MIAHKTKAPVIILPFSFDEGDFFVEVSYQDGLGITKAVGEGR